MGLHRCCSSHMPSQSCCQLLAVLTLTLWHHRHFRPGYDDASFSSHTATPFKLLLTGLNTLQTMGGDSYVTICPTPARPFGILKESTARPGQFSAYSSPYCMC